MRSFGVALLLAWSMWWLASLSAGQLLFAELTWVPACDVLGVDLEGPIRATRHRFAGGNPYREPFDDPLGRPHIYAPAAFVVYAAPALLPDRWAYPLWTTATVALAVSMTLVCLRTRRDLGLTPLPTTLALAALLGSTPLLFALERGSGDLVTLGLVVSAALFLRRGSLSADLLGGAALALAAWLKVYPALAFLALPLLGHRRAFFLGSGFGLLVLLTDPMGHLDWLASVRRYSSGFDHNIVPTAHSLSTSWSRLVGRESVLAEVPGVVAAVGLLVPLALALAWRLRRRDDLLLPTLLWLVALATFLPPASNDYNFVSLPLLLLATWDRRDAWYIHLALAPVLVGWQPLQIPFLAPKLLLVLKLTAVLGVGVALVRRARERERQAPTALTPLDIDTPLSTDASRPAFAPN